MAIEVITREDLNEFRELLLLDLNAMFNSKPQQQKQWLKSTEVRKMLNISSGTFAKFTHQRSFVLHQSGWHYFLRLCRFTKSFRK